jgi:hypothetical protein
VWFVLSRTDFDRRYEWDPPRPELKGSRATSMSRVA